MKKSLLSLFLLAGGVLSAQIRYYQEVFTQVNVTSDVTYGTNVDFLKNTSVVSQALGNLPQAMMENQDLQTLIATNQTIPTKYYDPNDATTILKVSDLKMDIYEPANDTIADRPVVIYVHTGNFLPPPLNGGPVGVKTDSAAIVACTKLAKRGFVAISVDYRLGWNPLAAGATGPIERRATLLNAVYRAIHDVKQSVRVLKEDASAANTYGIDTTRITLYGEGSGGYVVLAYATLDKQSETEIQKFVFPGTTDSSYVQPALVGDIDGFGGLLNIYSSNGHTSTTHFSLNTGGALADTSWLEAGDVPMVSFHCVRDPFAPFDEGTVIVPTTNEDVVDVQGPNVFMVKANALGNNNAYQNFTYNDSYTGEARAKYGQTYQYRASVQTSMTVDANAEGLFPVLRPYKANLFENEGSPWQWWDPNSAVAQTQIAPGVTAHMAGLQSNPDMSPSKGRTYLDTILNYAVPRMMVGMQIDGYMKIGLDENKLNSSLEFYPNPVKDILNFSSTADQSIDAIRITNISGQLVKAIAVEEGQTSVDLSALKAGVYMIEFRAGDQASVQKIVKQ